MKKILLSGCSHSVGFGLTDKTKSWGELFAKNNGHTLKNVSSSASSIQYGIQSITDEVQKEDYDTVILQLTTLDRYPISYNGEGVFLNNDITNVRENEPKLFHLVPANYLDAVEGREVPIKVENIRFFYEKVMYSEFYMNTLCNELFLLQQYFKNKKIDFILIPYDDYFWGTQSNMSIWRLESSKKIDKSRYVDYPFMKWLRENYNDKDYYIDNGFHLSEEGHRLFAEEYLPSFIHL